MGQWHLRGQIESSAFHKYSRGNGLDYIGLYCFEHCCTAKGREKTLRYNDPKASCKYGLDGSFRWIVLDLLGVPLEAWPQLQPIKMISTNGGETFNW